MPDKTASPPSSPFPYWGFHLGDNESMFYNFSTEDFTWTWGGKPYTFRAGKVYERTIISDNGMDSVTLTDVVSRIFAKHLAEKLLNDNKEVSKDPLKYNLTNMDMLTDRGVTPPGEDKPLPAFASELKVKTEPVVSEIIKDVKAPAPAPVEEKKKMGRPKKVASPSPDAEFAV